jgi:hypothetical protein
MSHSTLGPDGITGRTQTHRSQIMTLWVTRQDQEFITTNDLQLSDVELINATTELVGEPGTGYVGNIQTEFNSTINTIPVNDSGVFSSVKDIESENRISMKARLHHGSVDVTIGGMTQSHQFRQDSQHVDNRLQLVIPTDLGLISSRIQNQSWPPTPLRIESVKLEQRLRVHTNFIGNGPITNRQARFVEDWADSPAVQLSLLPQISRNPDGSVRYFADNDEGQSSSETCQVPSNCIVAMKLVFNIKPRTTL